MAASAGGVVSSVDRSRQMGLGGGQNGGHTRDRSSDSNGHNSEDETVLSGIEDEENTSNDQNAQDGKTKARKKKTRTVFSRSQVNILHIDLNQLVYHVFIRNSRLF